MYPKTILMWNQHRKLARLPLPINPKDLGEIYFTKKLIEWVIRFLEEILDLFLSHFWEEKNDQNLKTLNCVNSNSIFNLGTLWKATPGIWEFTHPWSDKKWSSRGITSVSKSKLQIVSKNIDFYAKFLILKAIV